MTNVRSVLIVGGGASGILLATHLLRAATERLEVTIVEKRGKLGRGLAYSAERPDYILNVPAANMSAFVDEPGHFRAWLDQAHPELSPEPGLFAPRQFYGPYLRTTLETVAEAAAHCSRLSVVEGEAVGLREGATGVELQLRDGTVRIADIAVLAVGHEEQPSRGRGIAVRADSDADTPLDPDVPVMILGSGLSMVDAWLSLSSRRHRGPVTIVSRHGLLPLNHRGTAPISIDAADVPFGSSMLRFTQWFRELVRRAESEGADWRSVVDGLRPYNQRIWQSWPRATRRQFLEHVRPFWNIHRHRLPPVLHARMSEAIATGQLRLIAGKLLELARTPDGMVDARIRRRGHEDSETLHVGRVYDCGGVTLDVSATSNAVVRSLLDSGKARPDDQRIGMDVTTTLELVGAERETSQRIYAVGPLTRGQFFEIEAIPDIRRQCAELATRLLAAA